MADLNVFSAVKMKLHLVVLESINLNKMKNYVKTVDESDLIDLFFFEIIKNCAICEFLF